MRLLTYPFQAETFEYDFEAEYESGPSKPGESALVKAQIAAGQSNPNQLTDAVFYRRHPDMRGKRLTADQTALTSEWMAILDTVVRPLLGGSATAGGGSRDADVAAARAIAQKPVPNMPGFTIERLIQVWQPTIAPEIPMPLLLAFMRFESGGNFSDATHGSPRNNPPYTQPAFYELGLFQTPAGNHGTCTSGSYASCAEAPPGREVPGDPSTWSRLCKKIGANPGDWQNPTTQVRVGLLDLKTSADGIRSAFPDLFPAASGDWYLRMAVLMPFARGGGFARAFLNKYRADLGKLPENKRWDFLRGKQAGYWSFDASNVDKKMDLAAKL